MVLFFVVNGDIKNALTLAICIVERLFGSEFGDAWHTTFNLQKIALTSSVEKKNYVSVLYML